MISQLGKLSLVLILGLLVWIFYQRQFWDYDYTKHQLSLQPFPPLDNTIDQHINPTYFDKATIIKNAQKLRYPEDIAVDSQGVIYVGLLDGEVVRVRDNGNQTQTIFKNQTVGRIFGIVITQDDSTLYFLAQFQGLIKVDLTTNKPTYLLSHHNNQKLGMPNGLCLDQSNQILYLTDSGPIRVHYVPKQILVRHKKGRVISYDLKTGISEVIVEGIGFANGIVFEKKRNAVVFAEMSKFKIWRYHIEEKRKEVVLDNMPVSGFADNLKLNEQGHLLIGFPSNLNSIFHWALNSEMTFFRKLSLYLPNGLLFALFPKIAGGVKIDLETGKVIEYMFGGTGKITFVTTILERNGKQYFTSLRSPVILVRDSQVQGDSGELKVEKEEL